MKNNSILIIDDEEQLRKLLGRIISLEGFKVDEAGTIKAGFDILNRKEIDVVLCDVKLPDGNGVDFVKEAKAKFPLPPDEESESDLNTFNDPYKSNFKQY